MAESSGSTIPWTPFFRPVSSWNSEMA